MPKEPPDLLPPVDPANYELRPFRWCQVQYLFARELTRAPDSTKVEWNEALSEANALVEIMQQAGSIMVPTPWQAAPGYTDLVHWPSLVCAANAYASMPPGQRQYIRDRIASGMPPAAILTLGAGGCHPKVLADEEYRPEPPCVPKQGAQAAWLFAGLFVLTIGGLFAIDSLRGR